MSNKEPFDILEKYDILKYHCLNGDYSDAYYRAGNITDSELRLRALIEISRFQQLDEAPDNGLPKLKKDCLRKIVTVTRSIKNRGGNIFPAGTMLVISEMNKKEKTIEVRHLKGKIILPIDGGDFKYIGDKPSIGVGEYQ